MDNVSLRLLTTARHHQRLEEFQSARAAGDVTNDDHEDQENEDILGDVSRRGEKRQPEFRQPDSPLSKKTAKKKRK